MMADLRAIAPRVAQLFRLLASDSDGEALAACRALGRTLASVGQDFHALAATIERSEPAARIHYECDPRADESARWLVTNHMSRLTARETDFVLSMLVWSGQPTERRRLWLSSIVSRMSGQRRRAS
jgi:hypothetical protein